MEYKKKAESDLAKKDKEIKKLRAQLLRQETKNTNKMNANGWITTSSESRPANRFDQHLTNDVDEDIENDNGLVESSELVEKYTPGKLLNSSYLPPPLLSASSRSSVSPSPKRKRSEAFRDTSSLNDMPPLKRMALAPIIEEDMNLEDMEEDEAMKSPSNVFPSDIVNATTISSKPEKTVNLF